MEKIKLPDEDLPKKFYDEASERLWRRGSKNRKIWVLAGVIVIPWLIAIPIGYPAWGFLSIPLLVFVLMANRESPANCAHCGTRMRRSIAQTWKGQVTEMTTEFFCEKCGASFSARRKRTRFEDTR